MTRLMLLLTWRPGNGLFNRFSVTPSVELMSIKNPEEKILLLSSILEIFRPIFQEL